MGTLQYLYFPGCKLIPFLPQYDRSLRALLAALDVTLNRAELNCCGYPVRHLDFTAAMFSGARVLAIAARQGVPLLTPCKCCYGNLKHADYWMRHNSELRERVNGLLKKEGLNWYAGITVRHLLSALSEDIGLDRVRLKIQRPLKELKVAAHYGCHALRPGDVTQFDNPLAPTLFEKIVAVTGAETVEWPLRLDCCGHPLWGKNNRVSLALMQRKLADAGAAGARILANACTYCQIQFDSVRRECLDPRKQFNDLPAVLVSQLLGFSFGLPLHTLGLTSDWKQT